MKSLWFGTMAVIAAAAGTPALAAPVTVLSMTMKDHRFSPAALSAPAGQPLEIQIANEDTATEEFDSHDLRVEKLVTPHSKVTIKLGPLKPGTYRFEGEFHATTAQGSLTVAP
jgi:hypothetical protein